MFNPHDLVPLAQAIGACLSATQLRRPSIKLPLKTLPNETCAAHFVGPGMLEEECSGQRHARILTVADICNRPHGYRAGLAFAGSPMDRLPARQIAPQAVRMVAHVVIGLDLLEPVEAARAPSKLSRKKKFVTRHGNTFCANLRGASCKIPRVSQFCHSDHSRGR